MVCRHVGNAIVCGPARRPPLCHHCKNVRAFLCDFPMDDGETCDRGLCRAHAAQVGPNRHYCPAHVEAAAQPSQGSLFA